MKNFWLLGGLILLCFFRIGTRPLAHPDEGRYATIGSEMLRTGEWIVPHLNGLVYFEKPPLGYWLIALGQKIFGHTLFGARCFNAAASILTCLCLYLFCKRFLSSTVGFWAALMYGTAALPFGLSQILTLDNFLTLFVTATLLSFASGFLEENPQSARKDFYRAYIFMALAVLTKGLIGIVLPALIGIPWLLMTRSFRRLFKTHLVKGWLLFFLIAAPWHIAVQHRYSCFAEFYFWHEHFERYLTNDHNRNQIWYFLPLAFLCGCLPWTFFVPRFLRSAWKHSMGKERAILLFSFCWAIGTLLFFSFSHSQLIPYILPAIPGAALFFAYSWNPLDRSKLSPECSLWSLTFLAAASLALPILHKRAILPVPSSLLTTLQILLFLGGCIGFLQAKHHARSAFHTLWTTFLLIEALLPCFMPFFQRWVGKTICEAIQQQNTKPQDVFCAYGYFSDFPFYLNQTVGSIHYIEEEHRFAWLRYGCKNYLSLQNFQERWKQPAICYAVVKQPDRSRFEQEMGMPSLVPLTEDSFFVLYKNQP